MFAAPRFMRAAGAPPAPQASSGEIYCLGQESLRFWVVLGRFVGHFQKQMSQHFLFSKVLKIWDLAMFYVHVSSSYEPAHDDHLFYCMASDQETESDCLVLGSALGDTAISHLTMVLVDPREMPDDTPGVQSLSIRQHLITVGSGSGNLFFYDTRKPGEFCAPVHSGSGWIRRDVRRQCTSEF